MINEAQLVIFVLSYQEKKSIFNVIYAIRIVCSMDYMERGKNEESDN